MPRWRLVVSGRVQTAGYRAMVKNIAIGLKVKGTAKNLDDGTVEIYCEASPEAFEKFKRAIDLKGDPKNIFAPLVEHIAVYDEKSPSYGIAPLKEFKAFKIDYTGVDPQIETLERSEMGIIALGAVNANIMAMHTDLKGSIKDMHTDLKEGFAETKKGLGRVEKGIERVEGAVKDMHEDQKEGFARVEGAIKDMHTDTKQSFDRVEGAIKDMHTDTKQSFAVMDQKYGMISQQMTIAITELQKTTSALISLTEKIGALIDKKLAE
ncbi:MAG: acylphosphatase [Candidatus Thermoplasmatota archaeon]